MYVESACFDPNTVQEGLAEDGFSQTAPNCTPTSFSMEDGVAVAASMGIEMQQRLGLDMEQSYNTSNGNLNGTHLMEAVVHHQSNNQVLSYDHHHHHDQSNWDPSVNHEMQQTMTFSHGEIQNGHLPGFNGSSPADLLNLFHLPRCSPSSVLTNSSLSFMNPNIPIQDNGSFPASLGFLGDFPSAESAAASNNVVYDPLFPLNLPPQPPLIRELFQSLPHGYSLPDPSRVDSLFGGVDHEGEENGGLYRDQGEGRDFGNGVFDQFSRDMKRMSRRRNRKGTTKHFATEQQRRHTFGSLYTSLKKLVPNPSKPDRASIVEDAIGYIKELLRTVKELKILVERKRCGIERGKRHKTEDGATGDVESCNQDQYYNGSSLRSSWLQRKSKDTEVDVRIIDDEVTIKLAQRKKINCLLLVSRVLDELQLDIQHVAGGLVGDNYSFLLNSKICEGSSVYASAIANKLIEVVDRQYSAIPPPSSY